MGDGETVACPSCGLRSARVQGPTHRHMPSSPGCWAVFGEVLAREFTDPAYFPLHQLTVDAYAASHPGGADRRAIRALALHLMTLQLFVEEGADARQGPMLHKRMVRRLPPLSGLDPPDLRGRLTAADVLAATVAAEHLRLVRAWADDVWAAWSRHHRTVREWVAQSLR